MIHLSQSHRTPALWAAIILASCGCGGSSSSGTAGAVGFGHLPVGSILYTQTQPDGSIQLRSISADGRTDSLYLAATSSIGAVSPSPTVKNLLIFAYRSAPNALFGIYANQTLSPVGATQLVAPRYNGFNTFEISRDGKQLVYVANIVAFGQTSLYSLRLDQPSAPNRHEAALEASIGADNDTVVFNSFVTGATTNTLQLFTRRLSGGGATQITTAPTQYSFPQFSKDGTRIVCSRLQAGNVQKLVVMNADGTGDFPLPEPPNFSAVGSSFNSDGTSIAFVGVATDASQHSGLYTIGIDGSNFRGLKVSNDIPPQSLYWTTNRGFSLVGSSLDHP